MCVFPLPCASLFPPASAGLCYLDCSSWPSGSTAYALTRKLAGWGFDHCRGCCDIIDLSVCVPSMSSIGLWPAFAAASAVYLGSGFSGAAGEARVFAAMEEASGIRDLRLEARMAACRSPMFRWNSVNASGYFHHCCYSWAQVAATCLVQVSMDSPQPVFRHCCYFIDSLVKLSEDSMILDPL